MAAPDQTLGRYKLQRKIGSGAMGLVYEALDPKLNRPVAIKTILKSQLDEEVSKEYSVRFREEAQAVARLNHPNIVQVYDFGEEGDVAFIVMEFIRGKDLKQCFDSSVRFEAKELVRLMGELLSALDYAHQAGIVHRDIKPANIMLDGQSRVKLMDFGVAKITDTDRTHRTQVGTMVGTPSYMSPEQVQGLICDHRSDLFSSGIVLYQFLTGQRPFTGGDWTLRKAIVHEDPVRPSQVNAGISPEFDRVIGRALAKAPEARYQSAGDFSRALQRVLEGKPAEDEEEGTVMRPYPGPAAAAPRPAEPRPAAVPPEARTSPTGGSQEVEVEFWRSIKDSNDAEDFDLYLQQFPQGAYARLAQRKIDKLRGSAPGAATGTGSTGATLEEEHRRQSEELARRQAEARKEAEARLRQEAEARARQEAEARVRQEAEARAKRELAEKAKREAEEKARLEAEHGRRESEDKARREAEARARRDAEEKARLEKERAQREAERAQQEAEAKAARLEAEAKANAAKLEAQAKARREAEEKARRQAEERLRLEAEAKAKREAEAKAKREAEEKARREAEAKARAKREAEDKARRQAEARAPAAAPAPKEQAEDDLAAQARAWIAERSEDLTREIATDKAPPPRRSPLVIPSILGALLVAGAAGAYFAFRSPEEAPVIAQPPLVVQPPPPVVKVDPPPPVQPKADDKAQREAAAKAKEAEKAREEAEKARLAAEQEKMREAARLAEEEKKREAAARLAEERSKQSEAAKLAEERKKQLEAARLAEERKKQLEAARIAEEQKKREAAKLAAEEKKREAARLAEEAKKREAARLAAEEEKKREAARLAEEAKKREAARLAAEEEKKREAARLAEEEKKRAAKLAEEQKIAKIADLYRRASELEGQGKVSEAVRLYTTAANSNHGPSAKRLGDIFSGGKGDVRADYVASLRWHTKARQLGEEVPIKGR